MEPKTYPIKPYIRHPPPPRVALLNAEGKVLDEFGNKLRFSNLPPNTSIYCSYDTARHLVTVRKYGESLCWNSEEIRWRNKHRDNVWKNRTSDVSVLRIIFPDDDERALKHLALWRDWLANYGAAPLSTMGSASWSLLRATLPKKLWLNSRDFPPIQWTCGGRIEMGVNGLGRFEGNIAQLDLPSAYATELGRLKYNGHWEKQPRKYDLDFWGKVDNPIFVSATVRVPKLTYGALLNRPDRRVTYLHSVVFNYFPAYECIFSGIWTIQELLSAREFGVKILEIDHLWKHIGGEYIFANWWNAILEGRQLPGFAKQLAKMTGNALWGRFCMDGEGGRKTIRRHNRDKKRTTNERVPITGGLPPDHALAETISGRVRAKIGWLMQNANDGLISAHTDGAWISGDISWMVSDEWRQKKVASRFDILTPQIYRYWASLIEQPTVIYAGSPPSLAPEKFERSWQRRERRLAKV